MSKFSKANRYMSDAREMQESQSPAPMSANGAADNSAYNPQHYARSKMDNGLCFDVFSRCVHNVRKCRHCHVIPLLNKRGEIVNFFVEHYRSSEQIISCTIGVGKINIESVKWRAANKPEMEENDDPDLLSSVPIQEVSIDSDLAQIFNGESITVEPDSTDHLKSSIGNQLEQVQKQMSASFSAPVVQKAARSLEQLVLLVIGLQYDTSLEAIVLRCVQFLSAITDGGIVMTLNDSLMKYVANANVPNILEGKSVKDVYKIENSTNSPELFEHGSMAIWDTLKQKVFTTHLSYILGTVFAFSTCKIKNVKFNHPIVEKVAERAAAEEIDAMDIIDHSIKLYNWVSSVGMACIEQQSFVPMMINTGTLAKCHERLYFWKKKFSDFKFSGKSKIEERQLMYAEVDTIVKNLEQFTKTNREKFMTVQASSLHREALALFSDVRAFVQKVDRVKVAFGIHLSGRPKCGKSTLAPMIAEQLCLAAGVEYREQDNAQINLMAPYQDELTNATQVVTINETLPIKEHLAKSAENAYNTSLALIDSVPYHPNRSSLEDKAAVTLTHLVVVSTGNNDQPFLGVAKTPGAWERRYPTIHTTVKKEYSDEFGRIVSSKCDGSNDYHLFDVYEYVYEGDRKTTVFWDHNGKQAKQINTAELFELLREKGIQHFAEQERLMQLHNSEKKKGCMECKRLSGYCVCSEEACKLIEPTVDSDGEPKENGPEMAILSTVSSTVFSMVWASVLPWINPFVKFQWLWSIDSCIGKVMQEEIIEELSYWPDALGCTAFSLLPERWTVRADGTLTWFGRKKDTFLRMIAAEKQIFLPLSYLFRRALCWGMMFFLFTMTFGYIMETHGLNPRGYEAVVFVDREYVKWDRYYFFPQFSEYVMKRREFYGAIGIFTEQYLDWNDFYVNIYFFQKILGKLYVPWLFRYTQSVAVIRQFEYAWWLMPLCVSTIVTTTMFFYMWWRRWLGFNQRYEELKRRSSTDAHLQTSLYERARRSTSEYNTLVPTAVGVIGAIVTGLMIWNSIRGTPESDLVRDEETKSWSDWFNFKRKVAEPFEVRNHSSDEGIAHVGKNVCEVSAVVDGKTRTLMTNYTRPGVLLLTRHFLKKDPFKEELLEYLDIKIKFPTFDHKARIYSKSAIRIANKDAVLVKIQKAPKWIKSIEHLLPKTSGTDYIKARILFKQNAELKQEVINCKYEDSVDSAGFDCGRGLSYKSQFTKKGFCGAPIFSDRRNGAIIGFHVAGRANGLASRLGFAQEILYDDYKKALDELEKQVSYISSPEMDDLRKVRFGINLIPEEGPHPSTEMFDEGFMDPFPCMQVLGHDPKLIKYRTRVRRSLLSKPIEKHFGERVRWKAPDLKEAWKHHNKAIQHVAEGAKEVPPDSLRWAVNDYWDTIFPALNQHINTNPDLCRKLTLDEAINGVQGSLYMGEFKMDTAAGIPGGTKESSGLFIRIDPYPDGRKRYKLSDEAKEYYEEMLQCFKDEKLFGIWVRTCLKDEVVKEDSEKVRIFYILECLFALICRQHFLPVAEFISRHPLTTECLVGVNCAGPEWEQTVSFLNELATDGKLVDWDYSKYDLKRSPDVMVASLKLMIRMTEQMGYTEESLKVMQIMAEELRCPIINWNGTIIWMYIWCSGNTMTVYGNSVENSLHQRVSFHWNGTRKLGDAFYQLGPFRDNEHIITYGDDGGSGSKPSVRSICNFSAKQEYFNFVGMKITDARKSDNPQDEVDAETVDFLKRRSVYHPELGCRVGALDTESIWKMGHMSSGSGEDEDLAVSGIQSMLTESFLHGKDFYDKIRSGLQKCATDVNIWTEALDVTYSEKVERWMEKYR